MSVGELSIYDVEYPQILKESPNPPPFLYYIGDLSALSGNNIAMVGSRKPSVYGEKHAESLAFALAKNGFTIVSGMARGIDTICHKAALNAGQRTIAVLGCGVDVVYPPENAEIKSIIEKNGIIISEYPLGTQPLPAYFPQRNRIIIGLSRGVVAVECTERSGTMTTINASKAAGRNVYTIPTNLDNHCGTGNIKLLKEGAKMVTCAKDILDDLGEAETFVQPKKQTKHAGLTQEQIAVAKYLHSTNPMHIEDLVQKTQMRVEKVNNQLMMLELMGRVKRLPGKFYIMN